MSKASTLCGATISTTFFTVCSSPILSLRQ